MSKPTRQRFYCFWRSNEFPFVDGAPLLHMHERGQIECEGYAGFLQHPLKIVVLAEGRRLHAQLKSLKCQREHQLNEIDVKYAGLVADVTPWRTTPDGAPC